MIIKTDIDLVGIADCLANSDANDQAIFLNAFFKSLDLACDTEFRVQMQLNYIEDKLSKRARDRINFMYDGDD